MHKLKFLLTIYARSFYKTLAVLIAAGAAVTLASWLTPWSGAVTLVFALFLAAIVAVSATLAISVLNVMVAAGLHRGIDRFEAAYDAYRRANAIPDIFYEEMDLAEAAAREDAMPMSSRCVG
jgi:hypothetical protein